MPLEDGAKGVIWSSGLHKVFIDRKPARLYTPQYTIPDTFELFKKEIEQNGGITLGIDHLPEQLVEQYPILKKLNLFDVGKITEIKHDGSKIYATKSEHSNPLIAELYARGELPAFSLVAPIDKVICENGRADFVLEKFRGIKRADYVDEGGCADCKTGIVPDDMILTAKLSMEVDTVVEETKKEKDENPSNESHEEDEEEEEDGSEAGETNEEEEEEEEKTTEPQFVTQEYFDKQIGILREAITGNSGNQEVDVEARFAKLELEAKKARVEPIVDNAIKENKILPVDKEMFINQGIEMDDNSKFSNMLAKRPSLKMLGEEAEHNMEASKSEFSYNDLVAARKRGKF